MRISECYIENFGKLHNETFILKDGINIINKENGWGKSTFAAFVKAMFYGLDSSRTKSSERKSYEPWQGGAYGGYVIFEVNNKRYKLERFFGKKEKDDSFKLYNADSGLISYDYTENIGEEIFEIDRLSYTKSAFIGQGYVEVDIERTSDISAKLSSLSGIENDMSSFDDAIKRLDDKKSIYVKRGGGKIKDIKAQISELTLKIKELNDLSPIVEKTKSYLNEKNKERIMLKERRSRAEDEKLYSLHKENEADSYKKLLEAEKLIKKVPTEKEIEELYTLNSQFSKAKYACESLKLSEEKASTLNYYKEKYKKHKEDADIDETKLLLAQYRKQIASAEANSLSEEEEIKLKELEPLFENKTATEKDCEDMLTATGKLNSIEDSLSHLVFVIKQLGRKNILFISALLLSVVPASLFALIGAVTLDYVAFILTAVFLTLILLLLRKLYRIEKEKSSLKKEAEDLKKQKQDYINTLSSFLSKYGYVYDTTSAARILDIKIKFTEYSLLKKRKDESRLSVTSSSLSDLIDKMKAIYCKYVAEGKIENPESDFETLWHELIKFEQLKDEEERYLESVKDSETAYKRLSDSCKKFTDSDPENGYNVIFDAFNIIKQAKINHQADVDKRIEFEKNKNINADDTIESTEHIDEIASRLDDEIRALKQRIEKDEENMGLIPELTERYVTLSDELAKAENIVEIIDKTKKALYAAKESIDTKYLGSVLTEFKKNASLLKAPENISLDTEYNVNITDYGQRREGTEYSAGMRDLFGICLRFALITSLFQKEKPVVILDDPFVNLDEERIKEAKALLEKLSLSYQVIYLVCHSSRE